jgi:iron complex transport system ATP-binding protein
MSALASLAAVSLGARITAVDLSIGPAECVVLVGKNGAGKSTALQLLSGLATPSAGTAVLSGRDAATLPEDERASLVAWLPQRPNVDGSLTAQEVVALARFRFVERPAESRQRAQGLLERTGVSHLADTRIDALSGGEVQRVLLAALRAQEAPLLLVDEPANHLDPLAQVQTYQTLGDLWQKEQVALVLVTHDLRLCQLLGPAPRILVVGLDAGRIVWRLPLDSEDLPRELGRLYGVPFAPAGVPGGLGILVDALGGSEW